MELATRNPLRILLYKVLYFKYMHQALFWLLLIGLFAVVAIFIAAIQAFASPPLMIGDGGFPIVETNPDGSQEYINSNGVGASVEADDNHSTSLIEQLFYNWGNSLWSYAGVILGQVSVENITASWSGLFSGNNVFNIVTKAASEVMKAFGYSALSIVYLVQVVKVSQRLDGNSTFPALKDIIFLMIFFVVAKLVVDNADEFCGAVYTLINNITQSLVSMDSSGFSGNNLSIDLSSKISGDLTWQDLYTKANLGGLPGFIVALGMFLGALVMNIVTYVVVLARSLQLYIYSIFAPIPLTLMWLDETRQWGVGFIKNFVALCLAGAIIVMVLILFVPILASVMSSVSAGGAMLPALAVIVFGVFALAKSGGWARDIVGG